MAEKELEKRIAQLEDIQAIRQLKARYCLYVDQRNEDAWVSRRDLFLARFAGSAAGRIWNLRFTRP